MEKQSSVVAGVPPAENNGIAADTALQKANHQRGGRIDALRRLPKAFGTARRPWSAP